MSQDIEKQTITLGRAALIIVSLSQAIITYTASQFGTKAAIKELEYKTNMEVQELKYEDKLIWNKINAITASTYRNEAIKPEDVRRKDYE